MEVERKFTVAELPSLDGAASFQPPAWIADEVTGDSAYLNETLAVKGAPG